MAKAKKEKIGKSVWKKYFTMLLRSKLPWVLMVVCFLISLARAQLTLSFADELGSAIREYTDINDAIAPLLMLFLIGMAIVVSKVAGSYLEGIVTAKVERNIQRYAVDRVFYLKSADIEKDDPRELVTRLTEDTAKSAKFLIDLAVNEIPRLYFIVNALIQVIKLGMPVLTITLILVIPVVLLGSFTAGKITFRNRNNIQLKIATLTAKLAEKIDNVEVIKSYNNIDGEISSGDAVIKELDKVKRLGAVVDQVNAFIKNLMWFLPLLCIIIPPATLLFNGQLDQGAFYAYILLATTFRSYTAEHLTLWIYLKDAQGSTLRLSTVLTLDNERPAENIVVPTAGSIEFKNVSFSYGSETVLNDVSFVIEKGKKTAMVGFSGSGKSTVMNLIERFYLPDSGSVLLDGKNIAELDCSGYRSLFTYLPQNAPGLSGTVRDMLNYSSKTAYTDEQLNAALEKVGLLEDVTALGGLDYEVGYQAEKLSGGQRQKIGVARLLLSDTEYVLMDEATSALDVEAAAMVQKHIDASCENRTQISIAHDLSTITNADKILVFCHGKLAAEGTHRELSESCELYNELLRG